MTRGRLLFGSAVALALLFGAESARADTLYIGDSAERIGSGGAFHVTSYSGSLAPVSSLITGVDGGQFNTFCIEKDEFISLGGEYAYSVGSAAIHGGAGGPDPDPLDSVTAKLFYAYWTGQLQGFEYSTGTDVDGSGVSEHGRDMRDLQNAFWYLEDEIGSSAGGETLAFITWASGKSWGNLGQEWTGVGGVRVLNLFDKTTGAVKQSQMIVVPLPTGALMGFALLGVLGVANRIRSRRQHSIV